MRRQERGRPSLSVGAALTAACLLGSSFPTHAAPELARDLKLTPRLSEILKEKPKVDPKVNRLYRMMNGVPKFKALAKEPEFELIPLDKMEYTPSEEEIQASLQVTPNLLKYKDYYKVVKFDPKLIGTLVCNKVDRRAQQTSIKNQGSRGTCVAHAALAALEVAYKPLSLDLSENYAYFKFLGSSQGNVCADPGLNTQTSGQLMTDHGMSPESCWPYVSTLAGIGCPLPIETPWPVAQCGAADTAKYRVTSHHKIYRNDSLTEDVGEWINNPKYLESVLCAGHDIVAGFYVAGWPQGGQGVIDAVQGASIVGGHAMVIVGFERGSNGNPSYVIAKNSWGAGYGQNGYVYLSYDYIRAYAKYGYYITGVKPVSKLKLPPLNKLILEPRIDPKLLKKGVKPVLTPLVEKPMLDRPILKRENIR